MGIEEFAETPAILHELLEFRVRVITLSGRRVHVPKLFYQEKQHAEEGVGVKSHRVDARRCRTIVGGGANPNRAERSEQWVQSVSSSTFGPAVCVDNPFLKVLSYRRSRPPLAAYSLPRGRGGRRRAALTYVMSAWLRPLPERQVLATQNRDPSPPPRPPTPLLPSPPREGRTEAPVGTPQFSSPPRRAGQRRRGPRSFPRIAATLRIAGRATRGMPRAPEEKKEQKRVGMPGPSNRQVKQEKRARRLSEVRCLFRVRRTPTPSASNWPRYLPRKLVGGGGSGVAVGATYKAVHATLRPELVAQADACAVLRTWFSRRGRPRGETSREHSRQGPQEVPRDHSLFDFVWISCSLLPPSVPGAPDTRCLLRRVPVQV